MTGLSLTAHRRGDDAPPMNGAARGATVSFGEVKVLSGLRCPRRDSNARHTV